MAISIRAVQGISHRKEVLYETTFVSGNTLKNFILELSIIKVAKGPFLPLAPSKISKVDKLAPSNVLHAARKRLYS